MTTTSDSSAGYRAVAVFLRLLALLTLGAGLSACGGGGGGGGGSGGGPNDPDPPPPPPPPPEPVASVPTDLPAIIVEISEDISQFNDVIGEVIEGNLQNFVQYVPATEEATLIATNASLSYAESISTVRVFDDRIFVLNVSETGARVQELALDTLFDSPAQEPIPTPENQDSVSERCFAVIGDDLFFKVAHRDAVFPQTGYQDGPLVRIDDFFGPAGGREITTLIPGIETGSGSPSPGGFVTDACRGYFDTVDGVWYDSEAGFVDGELRFYEKDIVSGEPQPVAALPDADPLLMTNLAYDDNFVYVAFLDPASQEFLLTRADLGTFADEQLVLASIGDFTTGFNATGIALLDADNGYVSWVFSGNDRDVVVLYEPMTGMLEFFDFDVRVNQLQLIFRNL